MRQETRVANTRRRIKVTRVVKQGESIIINLERPTDYGENIIECFCVEVPIEIVEVLKSFTDK